jgi:hypothetical protein
MGIVALKVDIELNAHYSASHHFAAPYLAVNQQNLPFRN